MPSIQITSVNYNDQVASITFYSSSDPATPVSLGSHTMPYVRTDNDVYGTYELNFAAYSKICSVSLSAPTTTTTTTTTTVTPTTTTTTTTTASPAGAFTLSGAGTSAVNGCYSEAGTYNGNPYYTNGAYYVWYEGYELTWFINESVGSGAPGYSGSGSSSTTLPENWNAVFEPAPAPAISNGCGSATTTTAAPTTTTSAPTTTTTTAAPGGSVPAYYVATNAAYGGKYCEDGVYDGKPKYRKTGTNYYIYWIVSMSGWGIYDDLGNTEPMVLAENVGGNTPPTGSLAFADFNTGGDLGVFDNFYTTASPPTLSTTYIYYGNTYNSKPAYEGGGLTLRYMTPIDPTLFGWWIEDPNQDPDNPVLLYQGPTENTNTPPLSGWTIVNGSSPAPTLVGPTC